MPFRARRFSLLFNYFCHGFGVTINALQRMRASCWDLQDNGRGTLEGGPGVVQATPKGKQCGPEREQGGGVAPQLAFGGRGGVSGDGGVLVV